MRHGVGQAWGIARLPPRSVGETGGRGAGQHVFRAPIVTRVEPLTAFYAAEEYHQDYAALNPEQPYIAAVAAPKVKKLRELFGDRLKSGRR